MKFKVMNIEIDIHKKYPLASKFMTDEEGRDYFNFRYYERKYEITRLIKQYNLKNMKCIDVGSGFGHDLILLAEHGNNQIISLEPNHHSFKMQNIFIKEKNLDKLISVFNINMEDYKGDDVFDLVFTSSPGNWMHSYYYKVITEAWLDFILKHVKHSGFFIARLYSGHHNYKSLVRKGFSDNLKAKLKSVGFNVLEYNVDSLMDEALLVAQKTIKI